MRFLLPIVAIILSLYGSVFNQAEEYDWRTEREYHTLEATDPFYSTHFEEQRSPEISSARCNLFRKGTSAGSSSFRAFRMELNPIYREFLNVFIPVSLSCSRIIFHRQFLI